LVFRNSIEGLDKVFKTDIEGPKVILITGPPGSLKTSFCYSLMSRYLQQTGEFGLYTTLEETVQSHLKNMESLGVDLSLNMQISDFTDLREIDQVVGPSDQTDYLAFIEKMLSHFKKVHGDRFRIFTLDSLGALYSLMEDVSDMRKKMFYFFKMVRGGDAPRERGVPRRRDRDARDGPVPRQARAVPAGREDAGVRAFHGEARDRSEEGRARGPRADFRDERIVAAPSRLMRGQDY